MLARGEKFFTMEIRGRKDIISVDRLKPHLGPSPVIPASLSRLGRPPGVALSASASYPHFLGSVGPCRATIPPAGQ
jgi:hypothetical protein